MTPTWREWVGQVARAVRSYWQGPGSSSDPRLNELFGWGRPATSGVSVSEDAALNYSAVWCAVTIIAGTVGSLPLFLYRRTGEDGRGKEKFDTHPLYWILHERWNPEMSSMIARETMQQHVLLWGNAYAEIVRDQAGRVSALWPLAPNRVFPYRDDTDARSPLRYTVTGKAGQSVDLRPDEILHIQGLSFDGIKGYGLVRRARESIGLGLATEKMGATFFGQGSHVGGVIESPTIFAGPQGETAINRVKDSWKAAHAGIDKAYQVAILEGGMTFKQTQMNADDAQFLETRKFQIDEIARWFNIPPHMLKDLERATFSNIEQQSIEFEKHTIRPWLIRWEQEINRKLIAPSERRIQFCEHVSDALLKGDTAARKEMYATGRQWGYLSVNEIRAYENLNPIPDGDIYLSPANMIPADQAANPPVPPPAPRPEPSEESEDQVREALKALGGDLAERFDRQTGAMRAEMGAKLADLAQQTADLAQSVPTRPEIAEQAQALAAHRTLLLDLAGRMIRRETGRARRAATSPERLRAWAEGFYPKHGPLFQGALTPALAAYFALSGQPVEGAGESARALVGAYLTASQTALTALLDAAPADLETAVDSLMARWELERPGELADRILIAEVAHE